MTGQDSFELVVPECRKMIDSTVHKIQDLLNKTITNQCISLWDDAELEDYLWQKVHDAWRNEFRYNISDSEYDKATEAVKPFLLNLVSTELLRRNKTKIVIHVDAEKCPF